MRRDRAAALRWAAMTRRRHRAAGRLLRVAAPALPDAVPPCRPIFILGSPRSGTTMLFQLLDRSQGVASLGYGSQFIWEMFRPRRMELGLSHAAGPSDITERERKVLELRFGLGDGYSRTLEEVGKQFKVTRERIRQIEAKALRKMRHPTRIRQLQGFLETEEAV